MTTLGNFPFGQPVRKLSQVDRSPKQVFVLGVYASAVHAKWISSPRKEFMRTKLLLLNMFLVGHLFFSGIAFGQRLDTLFTRVYSVAGLRSFAGVEIAKGSDNRYLIAASSWILSIDQKGDTNWTFRLPDSGLNSKGAALSIKECMDGDIIFLSKDYPLAFLSHLTHDGKVIWKTTFDNTQATFADCVFETPSGGFVFGESHNSTLRNGLVSNLVETDGAGKVLLQYPISDQGGTFFYLLMIRSLDNGYIIGCDNVNNTEDSVMIVKMDNLGNTKWSSYIRADSIRTIVPTAILQLGNGNIVVASAGTFKNGTSSYSRSIVTMLDSYGIKLWQMIGSIHSINDFIQENDSTIVFVGMTYSEACLGRIGINGGNNFKDVSSFNMTYGAGINSIVKAHDGGFVATGSGSGSTGNGTLFLQIKENPAPEFKVAHPNREVREDSKYCDTIQAVDEFPGEKLQYFVLGTVPIGLRLDSLSGIMSWTPLTESDSGNHRITVRVKDKMNQEDTMSWNLHVTPVNDPHEIIEITPLTVKEGDTSIFTVMVRDEENGTFNYRWELDGQEVSSNSLYSHRFSYTSQGQHRLYCKVFDLINSAESTVVVTVNNTPLPPKVLHPDSMQVSLHSMLHWGWLAPGKDPDLDSSTLRFRIYMYQVAKPSVQIIIDSLRSDSLRFMDMDSIKKFSSGMLSISIGAFDLKGYSTGLGKRTILSYSASMEIQTNSLAAIPRKFSTVYAHGKLTIGIPSNTEKGMQINLSLYDMRGRIIKKFYLTPVSPGFYSIWSPFQNVPPGQYYLQVASSRYRALIPCPMME